MLTASHRWSASLRSLLECVFISSIAGTSYPRHDHGGSRGIIILLWGRLQEQKWEKSGDQWIKTTVAQLKAPAISLILEEDIHDVYAEKTSAALHFYYPKPKECKMFP